MNNTPDPQGGQPEAQSPQDSGNQQNFDISQGQPSQHGQQSQPSQQGQTQGRQNQYGMLYERYQGQGQQYAQPNYAQGGATSANPQPDQQPSCGQADYRPQSDYSQQQPNYGQSQQPNYGQQQYSQSDYGQADYAQTRYSQPQTGPSPQSGYGYASGGYGQQYGYQNQNGYPQGGQPYAPQYGWPEPLPYGYQPRNKMVAGLLGIFLGWLGVHNFYLGHYGKAVAQLLLTLIGSIFFGLGAVASFIWGFIEGVLILSSDYGSPWHRDAKGVELRE